MKAITIIKGCARRHHQLLLTVVVVVATGVPICLAAGGFFEEEETISPIVGQANDQDFGHSVECVSTRRALVSAPKRFSDNRGAVDLINLLNGSVISTIVGEQAGDFFGASVALLKDVNGDGNEDFAVGAPGADNEDGKVYVVDGNTGAVLESFKARNLSADGSKFGSSVVSLGEIASDHYILVAAPEHRSSPARSPAPINSNTADGLVEVHKIAVSSPSVSPSLQPSSSPSVSPTDSISDSYIGYHEELGHSVAVFNDANGNGFKEFVAGAPSRVSDSTPPASEKGALWIFEWNPANYGIELLKNFYGSDEAFPLGQVVGNIGDIDGDGVEDVFASSPSPGESGKAGRFQVYSGVAVFVSASPTATPPFTSTPTPTYSPTATSPLPSSSPTSSSTPVPTPNMLCEVTYTTTGEDISFGFGAGATALGDIDKDGRNDFAVTYVGSKGGRGEVHVYSYDGNSCVLLDKISPPDTAANSYFGRSVHSGRCDLFDLGKSNLLIGSNVSEHGALHVFTDVSGDSSDSDDPLPTESEFWFRLGRNGTVIIKNDFDVDPANRCTMSLLARISIGKDVTELFTVDTSLTHQQQMRSVIEDMPRVQLVNGKKPIVHMATRTVCPDSEPYHSNVFARYMTCGLGEQGVTPTKWLNLLRTSFIGEDGAEAAKIRKRKRRILRKQKRIRKQRRLAR